jgi:hypothetical protein
MNQIDLEFKDSTVAIWIDDIIVTVEDLKTYKLDDYWIFKVEKARKYAGIVGPRLHEQGYYNSVKSQVIVKKTFTYKELNHLELPNWYRLDMNAARAKANRSYESCKMPEHLKN